MNGCVSTIQVRPYDHQIHTEVKRFTARLGMKFENEYDAQILTQSLYTFLFFLREQYGDELWQIYVNKVSKGASPSKAAIDVYQLSLNQLGGEMFSVLTKDNDRPLGEMKSKTISNYELFYDAQAGVEKDLPAIEYLLLRYEDEIVSYIASTPEIQNRFNRAVSKLAKGKVRLFLLSYQERIERAFSNLYSSAEASMGYGIKAPNQPPFLYANISFKYVGLATTVALVHELTHVT